MSWAQVREIFVRETKIALIIYPLGMLLGAVAAILYAYFGR